MNRWCDYDEIWCKLYHKRQNGARCTGNIKVTVITWEDKALEWKVAWYTLTDEAECRCTQSRSALWNNLPNENCYKSLGTLLTTNIKWNQVHKSK